MKAAKAGTVRIIAGEWRGRRLPVADLPGLRPSGDRSRETLFNWLQPHLRNADCLDLFAGTGVLGLEALSRGAASLVMVEKSRVAVAALRDSVRKLSSLEPGNRIQVVESDATRWLENLPARRFDLVFIDPPFGQGLAEAALRRLLTGGHLQPKALVYLESARDEIVAVPATAWETLRDKAMGEVHMQLLSPQLLE